MLLTRVCVIFCIGIMSANCFGQLVVGTEDDNNTSISLQTPPGQGGTYAPLFQESANALAWDGNQFHGSNGLQYWTAPMNGPSTIVADFSPVVEGGDQVIAGLAYGNGTLFGSDSASTATSNTPEGIYTIDAMGMTTLVFDFTVNGEDTLLDIGGLAFNSLDGLLYGTSDDPDMRGLVAIDIAAQSVSLVAPYPNDESDIDGLTIGEGIAYLIDDDDENPNGGGGLFYSYDLSQGTGGSFSFFEANLEASEVFSSAAFVTDGALILGDVNCDGVVNLLDVGPFVEALSTGTFNEKADLDQNGVLNLLDVGPFVELLSGGG